MRISSPDFSAKIENQNISPRDQTIRFIFRKIFFIIGESFEKFSDTFLVLNYLNIIVYFIITGGIPGRIRHFHDWFLTNLVAAFRIFFLVIRSPAVAIV